MRADFQVVNWAVAVKGYREAPFVWFSNISRTMRTVTLDLRFRQQFQTFKRTHRSIEIHHPGDKKCSGWNTQHPLRATVNVARLQGSTAREIQSPRWDLAKNVLELQNRKQKWEKHTKALSLKIGRNPVNTCNSESSFFGSCPCTLHLNRLPVTSVWLKIGYAASMA